MSLDVDSTRSPRRGIPSLPNQGCNPARTIPLERDRGFDRALHGGAWAGEESVLVRREQRSDFSRFVKREELVATGEFIPDLEIHERVRSPLIHAGVFTKDRSEERRVGKECRS